MLTVALDHSDPSVLTALQKSMMLGYMLHDVDKLKPSCMCCIFICKVVNVA